MKSESDLDHDLFHFPLCLEVTVLVPGTWWLSSMFTYFSTNLYQRIDITHLHSQHIVLALHHVMNLVFLIADKCSCKSLVISSWMLGRNRMDNINVSTRDGVWTHVHGFEFSSVPSWRRFSFMRKIVSVNRWWWFPSIATTCWYWHHWLID